MPATAFKRLILRAVLRDVYPMVIRLVAVPDSLDLTDFDDIFHAVLGWDSGAGYAFQIHGQEFNSFPGRNDQHGIRGVDDQSGGEPTLRQEAADALDAGGRAPTATDPHQGVEQRVGGRIPAMVSAVSHPRKGRSVTPDLEVHS